MTKDTLWSKDFVLVCVANFLMASAFYLLMPTLPLYLTDQLGLPESRVGVVLSTYTLATLLSRLFSGYLVDTFRRKPLFIVGLLLFTSSFIGYMFAVTITTFMLLRFLHGATWGITSVSGNTVAIDIIPPARRGQGIGFYGLSMNMGMAFAPWVAVEIYGSWGYDMLIISCLSAGLLAVGVASFIKARPHLPKTEASPISLDRFILVKALPIGLNLVLCSVSYGMIVSYGVLFGESIGISNAGFLFICMAVGIGISRVISGGLVDKGHLHTIAMLALTLLGVALVVFALVKNIWAFCGMALLCGVSFGTMIPAFQTLFVNMAHNNQRGTANSTYLTSFDVGIGSGMLLGGLVASYVNLSAAFLMGAGLAMLAVPYYRFISLAIYEKWKLREDSTTYQPVGERDSA